MKQEKTLSEKRTNLFKYQDGAVTLLLKRDKFYYPEEDVKKCFKDILKNQFVKFDFSGSEEYRKGFLDGVKHMKDKIRKKAGDKLT